MPRSRIRRRSAFTPPPERTNAASLVSPRWLQLLAWTIAALIILLNGALLWGMA